MTGKDHANVNRGFVPAEVTPVGPFRPWLTPVQIAVWCTLIGFALPPLGCIRRGGRVTRIQRGRLPKRLRGGSMNTSPSYGVLWLDEADAAVGYAMAQTLHETRVGHVVEVHVRPDTGQILRLRNRTRPRRWWQF